MTGVAAFTDAACLARHCRSKSHLTGRGIEPDEPVARQEHRVAASGDRGANPRRVARAIVGDRPEHFPGLRVERHDAGVLAADVGDDSVRPRRAANRRRQRSLSARRTGAWCPRSRSSCRSRDRRRGAAPRRRTYTRRHWRPPAPRAGPRRSRNRRGRTSDTRTATASCRWRHRWLRRPRDSTTRWKRMTRFCTTTGPLSPWPICRRQTTRGPVRAPCFTQGWSAVDAVAAGTEELGPVRRDRLRAKRKREHRRSEEEAFHRGTATMLTRMKSSRVRILGPPPV